MEYIVKYNGDILSLGYPTELLGHQYAILELEPDEVSELLEYPQIEYFEPSEGLSPFLQAGLDSACITPIKRLHRFRHRPDPSRVPYGKRGHPGALAMGYDHPWLPSPGISKRDRLFCQRDRRGKH